MKTHPLCDTKTRLVEVVESPRLRIPELEEAAAPHECRGRALRGSEENKVSGLGAIVADVTGRKHAEARMTIDLC